MFKQFQIKMILPFLSIISTFAVAQDKVACPTVEQIKQKIFAEWIPVYREGEELVSQADVNLFIQNVNRFHMAIWAADFLESAHCFYLGNNPVMDKIAIAQDAWRPDSNNDWFWTVPQKIAQCYAMNVENCLFIK